MSLSMVKNRESDIVIVIREGGGLISSISSSTVYYLCVFSSFVYIYRI